MIATTQEKRTIKGSVQLVKQHIPSAIVFSVDKILPTCEQDEKQKKTIIKYEKFIQSLIEIAKKRGVKIYIAAARNKQSEQELINNEARRHLSVKAVAER